MLNGVVKVWLSILLISSLIDSLPVKNTSAKKHIIDNSTQGRMIPVRSGCRKISMTWCCKIIYGDFFVDAFQRAEYLRHLNSDFSEPPRMRAITFNDIADQIPLQAIRIRQLKRQRDRFPVISFLCADSRTSDELWRAREIRISRGYSVLCQPNEEIGETQEDSIFKDPEIVGLLGISSPVIEGVRCVDSANPSNVGDPHLHKKRKERETTT